MISKEEVKKLADLARLQFREENLDEMGSKLGAILDYVGQINSVSTESLTVYDGINVSRIDEVTNKTGEYTDALIQSAPESHEGFIKVKKII